MVKEVKSTHKPLFKIEAELKKKFGASLQPIRKTTRKPWNLGGQIIGIDVRG